MINSFNKRTFIFAYEQQMRLLQQVESMEKKW